jgi:hypothetical protein
VYNQQLGVRQRPRLTKEVLILGMNDNSDASDTAMVQERVNCTRYHTAAANQPVLLWPLRGRARALAAPGSDKHHSNIFLTRFGRQCCSPAFA